MSPILILGAGYTGLRVAALLQKKGHDLITIRSKDINFTLPQSIQQLAHVAPHDCLVLHSIPSLPDNADAALLEALQNKAKRIVYFSTTGVYGAAEHVDETTPIAPRNPREQARAATEAAIERGPWQSLILRPAAIYGPDRGVHVAMAQGKYTLIGEGNNFISRIQVDDLAAIAAAGILSDLTGAYPVADQHPCTSREIADYCATTFGLPPAIGVTEAGVPISRRNNRQVDGRAICTRLGITLKFPSYKDALKPESSMLGPSY